MDLIELAKQFGEEIQNNEEYIKMKIAQQNLDIDEEFQKMLREFNEQKQRINDELAKEKPDNDLISELNRSVQDYYDKLMKNEKMIEYQKANKEFMDIMKTVNSIIMASVSGENPNMVDGCSGSCSTCFGC